jgi:hypothetical protein
MVAISPFEIVLAFRPARHKPFNSKAECWEVEPSAEITVLQKWRGDVRWSAP